MLYKIMGEGIIVDFLFFDMSDLIIFLGWRKSIE